MKIDITIKLKKGVADPEGENTKKALKLLGFDEVKEVETMKVFRITLDKEEKEEEVRKKGEDMCKKLLANPVIHDYFIKVDEEGDDHW